MVRVITSTILLLFSSLAVANWTISELDNPISYKLRGTLSSSGFDTQLKRNFLRPLSGAPLTLYIRDASNSSLLQTYSTTVNNDGSFQFDNNSWYLYYASNFVFEIEVEYESLFADILTAAGNTKTLKQLISGVDLQRGVGIIDDGEFAWWLTSANTLVEWAQSENLFGPQFQNLEITLDPNEDGASTGGSSNKVKLKQTLNYDHGSLAHELGHVILYSYGIRAFDTFSRIESCKTDTSKKCFVAPDGLSDRVLHNDQNLSNSTIATPLLVLHEEFANFFGAATLHELWKSDFLKNSPNADKYEMNMGGRDVYFGSQTRNTNTWGYPVLPVGIQKDTDAEYYVYPHTPILTYANGEATMLWDLYDDNSFTGDIFEIDWFNTDSTTQNNKRWINSFPARIDRVCFLNSSNIGGFAYNGSAYFNAAQKNYFSQTAIKDRELLFDNISIGIDDITSAVVKYGNDQEKSIRHRISREKFNLFSSQSEYTDVMRLHSNYYSFRLANSNKSMRHRNGEIHGDVIQSENADFEWKIVPSLARPWDPSYFSIESVNYPGTFVSHQNWILKQHYDDGTENFAKDASWKIANMGGSTPTQTFRFESLNYPNYVIARTSDTNSKLRLKAKSDIDEQAYEGLFTVRAEFPNLANTTGYNSNVAYCP